MRRQRRNMGYTLMEVVVAVAIVAIIAAIGIPSLREMMVNMEMARLNSAAKQIYLVGQNRLVTMRESGLLARLTDGGGLGSASLTEPEGSVTYSLACSDDATAAALDEVLPPGAIDHRLADGGHYLVVFLEGNKGLMREVYYAEKALPAWNAAALESWRNDPAARRAARIGFYDGGEVDMGAVKQLDAPILDVENGEVLELRVFLPVTVTDPGSVKARIRITDMSRESSQVEWRLNCAVGSGGFDRTETVGGSLAYVKVLDQLFTGKNFARVCPGITLGANIRVEVSLEPTNPTVDGVSYLPSASAYQDTNSLFAGMGTEVRSLSSGTYTNLQFQVSSGRHLQNLDLLMPEAGTGTAAVVANMDRLDDGAANQSIARFFSAVQTGDIDWGGRYPGKSFSPINGAANSGYGLVFYDGNNYEIRKFRQKEFHSGSSCRAWGLFGHLSNGALGYTVNGEVRGVRITDPFVDVKGEPNSSVGALGGIFGGIDVTDCHVYVKDTSYLDTYMIVSQESCSNIGGLVGTLMSGRIAYSSVSVPLISGNASTGVGGLAGLLQDNSSIVDGCYANVDNLKNERFTGGTGIGMLVGETEAYVANSYGIGTISGRAQFIGGLVGGDGGSGSRDRYVVDSYAIVSYFDVSTDHPIQAVTHTNSDQIQNACYVVWPEGSNTGRLSFEAGRGIECTLDELGGRFAGLPKWMAGGGANPYNPLLGNRYPYPSPKGILGMGTIHYGNWPVRGGGGGH